MGFDLRQFLASHSPLATETEVWNNGQLGLEVKSYIGADFPPLEYVTSVRTIVFQGTSLLTIGDGSSVYIMPGGRLEKGETLDQTLRRELLEETGWSIQNVALIGFKHFHHLNPKPPEYKYPYPDFFQMVYVADADAFIPGRLDSEYEHHGFRPIVEVQKLPLKPSEILYLQYALKRKTHCI